MDPSWTRWSRSFWTASCSRVGFAVSRGAHLYSTRSSVRSTTCGALRRHLHPLSARVLRGVVVVVLAAAIVVLGRPTPLALRFGGDLFGEYNERVQRVKQHLELVHGHLK